jgi:hypothetical protein
LLLFFVPAAATLPTGFTTECKHADLWPLPTLLLVAPAAAFTAAAAAPADISGSVPASLSQLSKLKLLDLEFNFLAGKLAPQQLCPAGNVLQAVYLRANNFTGSLNLTACRRLEVADIQVRVLGWGLLLAT